MDNFSKNLEALKQIDMILYLALKHFNANQHYEVFMTNDPVNYNIIDKTRNEALYLTKPIDEVMKKNESLINYSYYPFLYIYGLGNGVLIRILFNEQRQRIVVFEPELEIIFIVLNLLDFSSEIKERKLVIFYTKQISYMAIDSLFDLNKYSRIFVKIYDLIVSSPYYEHYKDDILRINGYFIKAIEQAVVSVGNDARDSIIGISNHIKNIPDVLKTPTLNEFINALEKRDTAIIVSTGPSLFKQLPLLKTISQYATIFCIDASFPILYKHNIKPDIVLSLERVEESAKFYYDTPTEAQKDVIFALTSIVHKRLKDSITKGTIQFSFRPFGYTSCFGLHEYGYIGVGMSAANMAYELVACARFKRCIFIGQDLAFGEDGSSHAKGALYGEREIQPEERARRGQQVFLTKYGGNGEVRSTKIWKLFLNFFEKDIAKTNSIIEVINSTEGGARINGTLEIPFSEAIKRIPKIKKSKIILTPPNELKIKRNTTKAKRKCLEIISYGMRHKKRIEKLFLDLVKVLEKIEQLNKDNKLEMIDFKKIERLSERIDKIKTLFNDVRFNGYFMDAIQSYIFHQELDIAKILVAYTANEEELKAKQIQWLYYHKYWLFSLAGGIDCVIEVIKEAMREWGE